MISVLHYNVPVAVPEWDVDTPLTVQLALTRACNMRCAHCFIANYGARMPFSEVHSTLLQLAAAGTELVNFTGGEIFSRSDIVAIFELTTKLGLSYGFTTNGTLVTPRIVNRLVRIPPEIVGVSLYGHTPQLHEEITKAPGSFEKTVRAIKLFASAGFNVTVKTMLTLANHTHISRIRQFGKELGARDVVFDPCFVRREDGSEEPWTFRLSGTKLRDFDESEFRAESQRFRRNLADSVCNAGVDRLAIGADGTVYPCGLFKLSIGNWRGSSLNCILQESANPKETRN